jgi:hypothetical protein
MQKKILIFVHTEYHLLLAINQILGIYNNPELYDIELFIRGGGGKRLTQELDFSGLPVRAKYFTEEVTIDKNLSKAARTAIEELLEKKPDVFIFFQEMDPLMVILAGALCQERHRGLSLSGWDETLCTFKISLTGTFKIFSPAKFMDEKKTGFLLNRGFHPSGQKNMPILNLSKKYI